MITTGTDVNHTFAVDVFARKNNLVISDMELAKEMAALLIRGKTIAWGAGEGFVSERTDHSGTAAIPEDGKPGWETGNFMVCNPAK